MRVLNRDYKPRNDSAKTGSDRSSTYYYYVADQAFPTRSHPETTRGKS